MSTFQGSPKMLNKTEKNWKGSAREGKKVKECKSENAFLTVWMALKRRFKVTLIVRMHGMIFFKGIKLHFKVSISEHNDLCSSELKVNCRQRKIQN